MKISKTEYPNPIFQRSDWLCLNGEWQFEFDDAKLAEKEHWERDCKPLSKRINVPFCFESKLSGLNDTSPHNRCFYRRSFCVPESWSGQEIILHFGAVDYSCNVFINGYPAGQHKGGSVGFSLNITNFLTEGENDLAVLCYDPYSDESIPRGKQFWKKESEGIWYTRTSGIWQTVWLEPISAVASISHLKFTPDIDRGEVAVEAEFSRKLPEMRLKVDISFGDEIVAEDVYSVTSSKGFRRSVNLFANKVFNSGAHGGQRFWSPENPVLFDVVLTLFVNGEETDKVSSYFGLRKIHTENGVTMLNNKPYYFKLVLDQGYWPESILTAPDDDAFIFDIETIKKMGFNGCRKHQKVEEPRFLYWADKLGILVWGEMGSPCVYNDAAAEGYRSEWYETLRRDYNHPSIVAWVPFNESWGIPEIKNNKYQQAHTECLYHLIKSYDQSRPVVCNDGWELTKTDICAIHNYAHGAVGETEKRSDFVESLQTTDGLLNSKPAGRNVFADGYHYSGQPILITECGGIKYGAAAGWGYSSAENEEQFLAEYQHVIESIIKSDVVFGFCYTQLTDIEQETNGLLTYDRKPKCSLEKIKEINDTYRHERRINR